MNWNYEQLFIKKETTPWTSVVGTKIFPVVSNTINNTCEIEKIEQIEWNMYWPTRSVPWKRKIGWNIDTFLTPSFLSFILNSIFWNPVTTNNWDWTYTHEFDYTESVTPSYTIESTKWNHVIRTSWNKVNDFDISVDSAKLKSSINIVWQYWTSVNQIVSYNDVTWVIEFSTENFIKTWDTVDIYDTTWNIIYWSKSVTAYNSTSITIDDWLTIPVDWSVTLSKRTWTQVDEVPFQFLSKTSVKVNWVTIPVRTFNLKWTNNIDVEGWFQSWSSYTQIVNTKLRTVTWSLTIDTDHAINLISSYNAWSSLPLEIVIENISWDTMTISWNITIDTVATSISTNTDITTPVDFSFQDITVLETTNTLANLDF